jgi:ferrous iron transport protein B
MDKEPRSQNTVALLGNPNVGKTSVFNILTGSRQSVGNWPGVTVEHKEGRYTCGDREIRVIDLPGIYSLAAESPDEQVARDYLLNSPPGLIINVVDASNLERNLYLTLQLLEMRLPVLVVLTMLDIAEQNGVEIETEHLKAHLGCPVITLKIYHRDSAQLLKTEIDAQLTTGMTPASVLSYDEVVELGLVKLSYALDLHKFGSVPDRKWLTLKLLEQDETYLKELDEAERTALSSVVKAIEKHRRQDIRNIIADDRYAVIRGLVKDVVKRRTGRSRTWSDRIDSVVLSSLLGLPIFFFVMFLVFSITIRAGQPLAGLISSALDWLFVRQTAALLNLLAAPAWLNELLANGIGGGLVTVATFVPPIFFIFASLAWLEDSGYMARAAFVADKFMRRIGLPGKAFIPLLVGFGCTVPAIMATRTLENKRDRIMTSLLTSFMSCGAKLPVYTFLGMIFFPKNASLMVFALYMSGIILGMLTGLLFRKTLFRSQPADFIMELPAYHLPTLNAILMHAWHRLKDFVLRAGKTILLVIVVLYALGQVRVNVPCPYDQGALDKVSVLEYAGMKLTPVFAPMGIERDNWHVGVALISGLFAKEAIVGSLQATYSGSNDPHQAHANADSKVIEQPALPVEQIISEHFRDRVSAFALLLFILLYSPCAAALTMLWKEHGKGWMAFAFGFLTLQAWLVATLFYQVMNWHKNSGRSLLWIMIVLGVFAFQYWILLIAGRKHAALV